MEGPGARYAIELLHKRHERRDFSCGVEALDRYIQRQASQDTRKHVAAVFVAVEKATTEVHGYYTLSMSGVALRSLPEKLLHEMPRYPSVPVVRLGRLAVREDCQGQRLGKFLLVGAMHRALHSEIAWHSMVVDAKDEKARSFYSRYGFLPFVDQPMRLFLPRATIGLKFR